MELRERILQATIEEFNEKSLKFTMNDLAKRLHISKKTLYTVFEDKESLFMAMVDWCFSEIKKTKEDMIANPVGDITDQLKMLFIAMPEQLQGLDWRQIYVLKDTYPHIYHKIEERLENGWEPIQVLFNQAVEEGKIRPCSFAVVKAIVEASIEHFISNPYLIRMDMNYQESLYEMVDIVMNGIRVKE